jgi:hypothetical protein
MSLLFSLRSFAVYLAFSKRLAASSNWRATVTPLASIMDSGFLVVAPLLGVIVGNLAVICLLVFTLGLPSE